MCSGKNHRWHSWGFLSFSPLITSLRPSPSVLCVLKSLTPIYLYYHPPAKPLPSLTWSTRWPLPGSFCAFSLAAFLFILQAENGEIFHNGTLDRSTSLLESLHQLSTVAGIASSSIPRPASPTCFSSAHPPCLPTAPSSVIIVPLPHGRTLPAKHLDALEPLLLLLSAWIALAHSFTWLVHF